ncbi:MAG: hypothetical protein JWP89_1993 [Schlesneria sp.]|nr:hypothetical protein [Schlesneria sp.]
MMIGITAAELSLHPNFCEFLIRPVPDVALKADGAIKRKMRNTRTARMRPYRFCSLFGLCGLVLLTVPAIGLGRPFELDFDGPETSWQIRCRKRDAKLETQERRREEARNGQAEFIRIRSNAENTPLRAEHKIPASRVLDEFTASLWVRSDRPGVTLAIRISIHGGKNPETQAALELIVEGDKYEEAGKWQQLKCRTADKAVNDKLRLLRAKYKVTIDPADMYVDQIILGSQLGNGVTEILIDDLQVEPIVPVDFTVDKQSAIRQVSGVDPQLKSVPVEFNLHKMRVEGKPFLPRVVPHRQERPEVLADAGFNAAWVGDIETLSNTGQFRDRGVWLTSTPPYAKGSDGQPLDSDDASLLPFTPSSSAVLFWMFGARMTIDGRPRLPSWTNQVRDADRAFKRPLAADIADDERIASRHLDMVGLSRHVLNSGVTLTEFRDEIVRRRERAWPGTFCFSWMQTEPAEELMDLKQISPEPPVLEPEQLRLQVYAALAAGCRGIGYWTTTPLDGDAPGARERYLMMTQLNLELGLMEPWLATGSNAQLISFTVDQTGKGPVKTIKKPAAVDPRKEGELRAALIRSELGALLLPMWLEGNSQYVPAALSAQTATIIVPGGGETATAWQLTTTGRVQPLNRETVAGGLKVVVQKFDQTAAILVTSDPSVIDQINQKVSAIQERSATVTVELCHLKLERVRKIDQQLHQLGVGNAESRQLLGQAKLHADMAEAKLKQQDYHAARHYACVAMQIARILQRAYWDNAVAKLTTPLASPYALCFQTLPAHWQLMRRVEKLGKSSDINKLPSGEFEDLDTLIAAGWRHEQRPTPDVQSAAELHQEAKQGKYSLRLAARPTAQDPNIFQFHTPPVSITSPAVTVHAGHLVKISGWVKTPHPIVRTVDGVMIYDSLLGKTGAIRILNAPDWQRFEVWRLVPESRTVTVTAEMHCLGELLLDDVRITAMPLSGELAEVPRNVDPNVKPSRFTPLDPFDLRRFNPLRERK